MSDITDLRGAERRARAQRVALDKPDQYTFCEYGDGTWQLITEVGYVVDWSDR